MWLSKPLATLGKDFDSSLEENSFFLVVNLLGKERDIMYVYVINKHGEPLMPCSSRKARTLLNNKKACVVKRTPFTIKLLHGSAGYKQPITLGVDAGSRYVGLW